MVNVEQIVANVKELEERFLEKDIDTGDPADDVDTGPLGDGQYDELEALTTVASGSAVSCMIVIEQMLRNHKEKISSMFGEDAESLLRQTQTCLQEIADMFENEDDEDEEDEEKDEVDSEEEPEEKEPKKEPEEKPEEPKEK